MPVALANTFAGSGYDEEPVTGDAIRDEVPELADAADPVGEATVLDLAGIPELTLQVSSLARLPFGAVGAGRPEARCSMKCLRPTAHPFVVTVHPGSQITVPTAQWLGVPEVVAP